MSEQVTALVKSALDSLMSPVHADSAGNDGPRASVPYVAHRGAKSKNAGALDAAGITVLPDGSGMFYLMDTGEPLKSAAQANGRALPLHLLQYARLYTLTDDDGAILDAMTTPPDDGQFKEGFREHIFGVVAVVLDRGQYTAATIQVQSALTAALRPAINLLGEPGRPGPAMNKAAWAARSVKHKASAEVAVPGGRFRTMISSTLTPPKSGKGQPHNEGHGTVYPTPEEEVPALSAWFGSAEHPNVNLILAITKFNKQLADAREKIGAAGGP